MLAQSISLITGLVPSAGGNNQGIGRMGFLDSSLADQRRRDRTSRQRSQHYSSEVSAQIRAHVGHNRMNHAASAVAVVPGKQSEKKPRGDNDRYGGKIAAQTQERKVNQAERHGANYCSKREVVTEEPPTPGEE